MKLLKTDQTSVEIEDDARNRATVFRGDDGRWKCLRCQRYRCEHALFVNQANPVLPPAPTLTPEDLADLIDE
jgi:hypothetical protein